VPAPGNFAEVDVVVGPPRPFLPPSCSSTLAAAFPAVVRWAVDKGFDLIDVSLSTTRARYTDELRAIADDAVFRRTVIVASAHNSPVESYP